jgi:hypothetical protein
MSKFRKFLEFQRIDEQPQQPPQDDVWDLYSSQGQGRSGYSREHEDWTKALEQIHKVAMNAKSAAELRGRNVQVRGSHFVNTWMQGDVVYGIDPREISGAGYGQGRIPLPQINQLEKAGIISKDTQTPADPQTGMRDFRQINMSVLKQTYEQSKQSEKWGKEGWNKWGRQKAKDALRGLPRTIVGKALSPSKIPNWADQAGFGAD